MGEFDSHRGADGTFSDDRARGKPPGKEAGEEVCKDAEPPRKDPKDVPAGNPLQSGEHPDPRR